MCSGVLDVLRYAEIGVEIGVDGVGGIVTATGICSTALLPISVSVPESLSVSSTYPSAFGD